MFSSPLVVPRWRPSYITIRSCHPPETQPLWHGKAASHLCSNKRRYWLWFQLAWCRSHPIFFGISTTFSSCPIENPLCSTLAVWLHLGHSRTSWPLTWAYKKIQRVKPNLQLFSFKQCYNHSYLTNYWNSSLSCGIIVKSLMYVC